MAIDPYRMCPCGSGKKMKFCCSKDILSELDKVIRAIEGEQRVAALDQVSKLIDEKGPRAALLSLKANLQVAMENLDEAEKTISKLAESVPHSPTTLGLQAILEVRRGDVEAAVDSLQSAMEFIEHDVPGPVYTAIAAIAGAWLEAGDILAARGHLSLQASLAPENDQGPLSMLLQLDRLGDIHPLLKEDFPLASPPTTEPWIGEFNAAMITARRGAWRAACESLASLADKVPGQPAILHNIAVLRGWLGQDKPAVKAWHEFARLEKVALDDAVEAEALAQYLDPDAFDLIERVMTTYKVQDADRLMERLLSDRRLVPLPDGGRRIVEEGQPPPRGAFILLDRPLAAAEDITQPEQLPVVLGIVAAFGRETDREARVEVRAGNSGDKAITAASLAEVAGDAIGGVVSEESLGSLPLTEWLFSTRFYLPPGTDAAKQQQVVDAVRRRVLFEEWPERQLASLGNRSPRKLAQEPAGKVPVLAAILQLELLEEDGDPVRFNELRAKLGLPSAELIDPAGIDLRFLPLVRLRRLDVAKLNDDQLLLAFQRAMVKALKGTMQSLAREVLLRDSLRSRINRESFYDVAIQTSPNADRALEYVTQAREYSEQHRQSPARWMVAELPLRLLRGESEEAGRLLTTLQAKHMREPGIAQALTETLGRLGLLRPREGEAETPAAAAAPPETKKLWTPDSGVGPAPTGGGPSKLFIPGRD